MSRIHSDWLKAYVDYASFTEAPRRMHFWSGVSAIAGALRRRVWIDMAYFKWYPNFYIVIVAPPGIIAKSTTVDVAYNLLRKVPGINFGPDVVTWQALVKAFSECSEHYEYGNEYHTMSAFSIASSEFGNLLNPQDRDMVDLLVTLWDSRQGAFNKVTKMSGNDTVENPWINLIACTTPSWIAGNFPEYVIGGGFTSRCIFVYGDKKDKLVAYPHLDVPDDLHHRRDGLIHDLEHIAANLLGPFTLTPDALKWGLAWYKDHYDHRPALLDDDRFGGYIARKQTHVHKLSLILSAAQRDDQLITEEDLYVANLMVTELEVDMPHVFAKIGRSDQSVQAERFVQFITKRKSVPYEEAYKYIYTYFPDAKDFEGIMTGAIRAGMISLVTKGNAMYLEAKFDVNQTSVIGS